jgi:hypothetical protein
MTAPNNWHPHPGVTRINFDVIGGGGHYPPLWWRRWGKSLFIFGGWAIAAIVIFWRM